MGKLWTPTRRKLLVGGALLIAAPAVLRAQVPMTGAGLAKPASGAPFTPASLPNLKGWWKGDVGTFSDSLGTTPATNGQAVKNWQDNSGTGNPLLAPTSAQTLETNTLNGLSTIASSGSTNPPLMASIALSAPTKLSCFGVFQYTSAVVSTRFISVVGFGQTHDYDNTASALTGVNNSTQSTLYTNNGAPQLFYATATNVWAQQGFIFDATNATVFVGGVSASSGANTNSFTSPISFGMGNDALVGGGPDGLIGNCAELFMGDADWSAYTASIKSYLLARWGV